MKKLAVLLFLLVILSGCGQKKVQIQWSAPTDGGPIDHYTVIVTSREDSKTFQTSNTEISVKLEKGQTYSAVVAGVGPTGKVGPFSEQSDLFTVR